MFYKFLHHDLTYGLLLHWKRCIVTFLMFFCLSFSHFLTLRIYELIHPEFFDAPVTTADYFFAMAGGCGQPEILDGAPSFFSIPTSWAVFVLWILFACLYYPFVELQGIGKQLMVLSGSRWIWWLSKCVWAVANTMVHFLLALLSSMACGLLLGAKPGMQANSYVALELQMRMDRLTSTTTWDMGAVFLFFCFSLVAFALMQLALSVVIRPVFSYLAISAYLFAGIYLQSPCFLGNYLMPARYDLLTGTGVSTGQGLLIFVWLIALSILLGGLCFCHMDVLGGTSD